MKKLAVLLISVALPGLAMAEDVFIRIEAKRDLGSAQAAAAEWQARAGDLPAVTFPLSSKWTAIALGPLPREVAESRINSLKAAKTIPADSFLIPAEGIVINGTAGSVSEPAGSQATQPGGNPSTAAISGITTSPPEAANTTVSPEPTQAPPPPQDYFIRFESFQDRAQADAALIKWRTTIPEAGIWQLPNGWFAIAAGPLGEAAANQWLTALKNGKAIPADSLISDSTEIGNNVTPGTAPQWPANPDNLPELPDLTEVQKLLTWAGFYNGEIDGKDGPQTRAAIAAGVASQREAADPGLALQKLKERQEQWRAEIGLEVLNDDYSGLSLTAPLKLIQHDRNDRNMSIYAPKDESGVALILISAPGGQQEMEDMAGLITALGWVPSPERHITRGRAGLTGKNDLHAGYSRLRVADNHVEGWVLIWPADDAMNGQHVAAEITESFSRTQPSAAERATSDTADVSASTGAVISPSGVEETQSQ